MSNYLASALDQYAALIAQRSGLRVTRDPATAIPPCVLIDTPSIASRTLGAFTLSVPVHLIGTGPGDKTSGDDLLMGIPGLMEAVEATEANARPITVGEVTYPAMTITATITITKE
jgi:hypothetical protein